ncbi:MAG: hypothetical protein EAZ62_04865 [Sphingobacteriia bacterium]|nr:MAG: hypothetical protein EAZ62_04865 [Sphingobacteriia bacterium]
MHHTTTQKIRLTLALLAIVSLPFFTMGQATSLQKKEVELFCGSWTGSLTYLDYSSGKPYTMPAKTQINFLSKGNGLQVKMIYPDEPKANGIDTILLDAQGQKWDGDALVQKRVLADGNLEIITERQGRDGNDNKAATIRKTITIGPKVYVSRKDVKFIGTDQWIQRHEYRYAKD